MKIAVTGGAGFLGQATIRAAEDMGHDVWSFDRKDGGDILGDLTGLQDANTVIHLSGVLGTSELFDTPDLAVDVNIKGTLRVLEWCRQNNAGFVGITMPPVFPSVYAATKVCSAQLASAWHKAYGVPVSHVRAFNAYGTHQAHGEGHPQKIVPTFSVLGWKNKPLSIWGDGQQTMDLIDARDVGRMLVDATAFKNDETFDAGTGHPITVNEFAGMVLEETGSSAGIEYHPMRIGEEPTQIVAEGEGWNLLNWRPRFNRVSLKETIWSYLDA